MPGRVHLYENVRLAANKKRTAAAPKIAAGVNYLFSLKIFSFPLLLPSSNSRPRLQALSKSFCSKSQLQKLIFAKRDSLLRHQSHQQQQEQEQQAAFVCCK